MSNQNVADSRPVPLASTTVYEGETVATTVTFAMGSVRGVDAAELPPIHDAVDTDALDALFQGSARTGQVSFPYCDHLVVVDGNGRVEIHDRPV
ncbi:hypothetical protein HUG10_04805 [Halorarum halophilum]|uniref:Halobacterial output domain-containing protein n=1 Tax=Halorarum halophilum TaxID=2743090 RepID=A0A7D5KLK6_9EURY|nr:HalOD1 output domain-containing protein [Halobaculum halophilum]QLG26902.1 hypothetical protein HUG10_04805 [Halobaculum halophilum]